MINIGRIQGINVAWRSHPDPLYGHIDIPPIAQRLLSFPEVRRLGRLRQLADISLSLPAATHTRLVHSLGAMHIAGIFFDRLLQRSLVQKSYWESMELPKLIPEMRVAVQIAALMHDIGHGPLSHLFDTVMRRRASESFITHELRASKFIFKSKILEGQSNLFMESKAIALMTRGLSPLPDSPEFFFLGQIVNSEIDADRMDYLHRDAKYTGINVGYFDPWPILDAVTLSKDKDKKTVRLALPIEAEGAAKDLLTARYRAYTRLYNSPEALGTHELLLLAFDEEFPNGLSNSEVELLSKETDEGLLIGLEKNTKSKIVKDVVRRFRDDSPYLVLPIKLANPYINLTDKIKRTIARWRRPLSTEDMQSHKNAISNVSQKCLGSQGGAEGTWRTLIILEEAGGTNQKPLKTPWIIDRPDEPARPIDWEPPEIDLEKKGISLAVPPEWFLPIQIENEIKKVNSFSKALNVALKHLKEIKIGLIYSAWVNELDANVKIEEDRIENETANWLARSVWGV